MNLFTLSMALCRKLPRGRGPCSDPLRHDFANGCLGFYILATTSIKMSWLHFFLCFFFVSSSGVQQSACLGRGPPSFVERALRRELRRLPSFPQHATEGVWFHELPLVWTWATGQACAASHRPSQCSVLWVKIRYRAWLKAGDRHGITDLAHQRQKQ